MAKVTTRRLGRETKVLCSECGCLLWSSATSAFPDPPSNVGIGHKCGWYWPKAGG